MSERLADVPPFTFHGVVFRCIAIDEQRYEWRSESGRSVVGRITGTGTYWAKIDGHEMNRSYPTLRAAMASVLDHRERKSA